MTSASLCYACCVLKAIYLDHNATTPLAPDLKPKVLEWLEAWGNPSSIHHAGRGPKVLLREARQSIAQLLGVQPLELIFTSGGSEANNLALKGIVGSVGRGRDRIVISAVEHPSLRKTAESLKALGFQIDVVGVNSQGEFDLDQLRAVVSEKTALVSVMYANNETGHIFPIRQIVDAAHAVGALVHCDAVQALGKMPIKLPDLGVDLASFSGHKFYALKGCGVLFARRGLRLQSLIDGGGQERGRRAGTENVLAIASLGYMCAKADEILPHAERMMRLRDKLETRVHHEIEGIHITGQSGLRLPNTSSMFIDGIDGETLLMNLDVRGFAVSTGAACSSGSPEPSPILLAMGLSRQEAQSSLRLSIGWETTEEDLDAFAVNLKEVVARLRKFKHGESYVYGL